MIGYERHSHNKNAGFRAHAIICLSSCIMTIVSIYGFEGFKYDASRVAAGIVSGMGFLGAGVIFVRYGNVSGLSTAAGMWATAGVGMAIGSGLYHVGIVASVMILLIQSLLDSSSPLVKKRVIRNIALEMGPGGHNLKNLREFLNGKGITYQVMNVKTLSAELLRVEMQLSLDSTDDTNELINELTAQKYIQSVYLI
jgi:putative Mg2+ transporter-C (MgtC) family protein